MKTVMGELKGKADGKVIGAAVDALLKSNDTQGLVGLKKVDGPIFIGAWYELQTISVGGRADVAALYMASFNAPPWNEHWTLETASQRLRQMLQRPSAYGCWLMRNRAFAA